jgi:DNA-binding transcriptional LysR family regulator
MKLFERAGLRPTISQVAEEKQTIVNLVAAKVGLAIVPRWTSRLKVAGVRFVPLVAKQGDGNSLLPLAAARLRGANDPLCEAMLSVLRLRLPRYAAGA